MAAVRTSEVEATLEEAGHELLFSNIFFK